MTRLFFSLFIVASVTAFSQTIQKSWIKTSVEDFTGRMPVPDTVYLRYEIGRSIVNFSFEPAWTDYQQPCSLKDNNLTIGFDTWTVEQLSDSSLIIYLKDFRRMKFVAEDYLTRKDEYLQLIGEYNGKPLYKANQYISPRYKRDVPLRTDIHKQQLEQYNIYKAMTFSMSFIVSEKGEVENVRVLKGIAEGYDKMVVRELVKTSKHWKPAVHKGKAIQTEMFYEIRFLDSIIQRSLKD